MRSRGKQAGLFHLPLLLLLFISIQVQISAGSDTIFAGQALSGDDTIISKGGVFEMGLFSPGNSNNYYLGIWYKWLPIPEKTVVWVANREQPISNPNSTSLEFDENGNLVLFSPSGVIWSINLSFVNPLSNAIVGVLGDDGNFIIRERFNSSSILWQSFDHPTDTLLPGAKLGYNNQTGIKTILRSWKDADNPALGIFSAEAVRVIDYFNDHIAIQVQESNSSQNLTIKQDGYIEVEMNYYPHASFATNNNQSYYWAYSAVYPSSMVRLVLDVSGQLNLFVWWKGLQRWKLIPSSPTGYPDCSCGDFTICSYNITLKMECRCVEGFVYDHRDIYAYGYRCTREAPLHCTNGTNDKFSIIPSIRYPLNPRLYKVSNSGDCQLRCLVDCDCSAHAYQNDTCFIWNGTFSSLHQLSSEEEIGGDFYVRLAASEIQKSGSMKHIMILVILISGLVSLSGISIMLFIMWRNFHRGSLEVMGDTLMHFKHQDLRKATKNFTQKLGEGGFSIVYKGELLSDSSLIAVKQLRGQIYGDKQLRAEVGTIGIVQHKNLVRLRGFCLERSKRYLVYDYMPNGSLESHLFKVRTNFLDWATRYNIAIGTAKGLAYLHESCRDCIIHCDIKPENILLDSDFTPKISDFGLAKLLGRNFNQVLTTMRGTRGYLAPEWFSGEPITAKVDVYSYGQVLLEIISGKRNMDLPNDELTNYFPALVLNALNNGGEVATLVDPILEGEVNVEELTRACKVACWCIQDHEQDRPTMAQVIQILEGVLQVSIPPTPQFFLSLAEGSMNTWDVKESEVYSTSSSLPVSYSFEPPVLPIRHMT